VVFKNKFTIIITMDVYTEQGRLHDKDTRAFNNDGYFVAEKS